MAASPLNLYQGQPGTTETAVYTVPNGRTLVLLAIRCANATGSSASARVSLIPAGGVPAAANQILPDVAIAAHDLVGDTDPHVLPAGGKIAVAASAPATITTTISGVLL